MTRLGDRLFLAEHNSDKMHVYSTDAKYISTATLADVASLRAIASFGNELILASKQGLFITRLEKSMFTQIVNKFASAVATNAPAIYALIPELGEILVVQGIADKWELLNRVQLNGFKLECSDTDQPFHLQVTKKYIYVSSWSMRTIQQYDFEGNCIQKLHNGPTSQQLYFMAVCATDVADNVLVSDKKLGLLRLSHCGHWIRSSQTVNNPIYVVFDGKHTMYALTHNGEGSSPKVDFATHLEVYDLRKINL